MNNERLLKYDQLGYFHFWLTSKYIILSDILQRFYAGAFPKRILDIGCGGGAFLERLKIFKSKAFGIDLDYEILNTLSRRNSHINTTVADAKNLPFRNNCFDLVTLIDVLEHIDDGKGLILTIKKTLNDKGVLLVCVPAYSALYGKHDKMYGHKRRYSRKELIELLERAGFMVIRATYFQPAFVLPLWIKRKILITSSTNDDFIMLPKPINSIINKILCMEKYYLRRFNFSFGATLICLSQSKP